MDIGRRRCLQLIAAMGLARGVHAENPLLCVYSEDFAPWSYKTGDVTQGLAVDLLSALLGDVLQQSLNHMSLPWKRAQLMVERGDADIMCTVPSVQRSEYCVSSALPIFSTPVRVFVSRQSPKSEALLKARSREALLALQPSIVTYQGSGWLPELLGNQKNLLDFAPSLERCLKILALGRADVTIENRLVTTRNLERLGLTDQVIEGTLDVDTLHYHVMLSRRSHNAALIDRINEAMPKFKASATYRKILAGYRA